MTQKDNMVGAMDPDRDAAAERETAKAGDSVTIEYLGLNIEVEDIGNERVCWVKITAADGSVYEFKIAEKSFLALRGMKTAGHDPVVWSSGKERGESQDLVRVGGLAQVDVSVGADFEHEGLEGEIVEILSDIGDDVFTVDIANRQPYIISRKHLKVLVGKDGEPVLASDLKSEPVGFAFDAELTPQNLKDLEELAARMRGKIEEK